MIFKKMIFLFLLQLPFLAFAQINTGNIENKNPDVLIRKVLSDQVDAWNKGDLTLYMSGYWKSDSLMFIGKNNIQYGWQKTLDAYKKSYPDKISMGLLTFDDITIDLLSNEAAFVIGKWSLIREKGNMFGIFTLLFKRINGSWFIVCDHTS